MQKFDRDPSSLKNTDTLVLVCRQKSWCIKMVNKLKLKKKRKKKKRKKEEEEEEEEDTTGKQVVLRAHS